MGEEVAQEAAGGAPAKRTQFSRAQRLQLWLMVAAATWLIRLVGRTLRLGYSLEPGALADAPHKRSIYAFWHRCILSAAYAYREKQLGIMVSRSFDGEIIARIIEKLGYVAVRGSSSRGAATALRETHRILEQGGSVVFAADGPRGPREVAKPGAALLAGKTGAPLVAFHIAFERPWVLRSWDGMMVPRPFSRGVLRITAPFTVPADAGDETLAEAAAELQRRLDRAARDAEAIVGRGECRGLPRVQ